MTDAEKLANLKMLLEDGGEMPSDEKLTVYLNAASDKILSWRYHLIGGVPEDVTSVPHEYEWDQIYAVIAGYTHAGAEGQSSHAENGVTRHFIDADMMRYIERNVTAFVRVGAVK
jgi:hypothetical protein